MRTIKNLFLQFLFFLLSCCKPVIGNKKIVSQERTTPSYSQIKVLGNADIVLTEGNVGQIVVETSENVLPYIATQVKGEVLVIKLKHYGVNYVPKLRIHIPIDENFQKITIVGKGIVTTHKNFSLQLHSLEVVLKGDGNFLGKELSTRKAILSIAGAGNIEATVTESVQAKIMGYGNISIFGNPPQRDTNIKGSGKIEFL
ncbi:GIN domain-containing protein [Capnocytophaga sputigena]|uniref:GIN domain-containing protein n=1 Tax=Capnocytophaga sputigena TaxID=1019 RepID=UPI002889B52E|nr:DUF2807 domain-containing protein [Capnocytophaga sputigena]